MARLHFEDEAQLYAYKAWETLKLQPPVDMEAVAVRLGVDIHRQEFVEEIDGFYLRIPGCPPIIAVNSSYTKPQGRQRFTTAHEIGHHLLARRQPPSSKLFFIDGLSTGRGMVERACDRFAALLLMPEGITRAWFEQLSGNPDYRVGIMAERFGVSPQAMRVRLKELGLPYETFRYRPR